MKIKLTLIALLLITAASCKKEKLDPNRPATIDLQGAIKLGNASNLATQLFINSIVKESTNLKNSHPDILSQNIWISNQTNNIVYPTFSIEHTGVTGVTGSYWYYTYPLEGKITNYKEIKEWHLIVPHVGFGSTVKDGDTYQFSMPIRSSWYVGIVFVQNGFDVSTGKVLDIRTIDQSRLFFTDSKLNTNGNKQISLVNKQVPGAEHEQQYGFVEDLSLNVSNCDFDYEDQVYRIDMSVYVPFQAFTGQFK